MRSIIPFFCLVCLSCTHTYYVVRHAEKEDGGPNMASNMTSDVRLTRAGRERAEQLKEILKTAKIRNVYSTNYLRTRETAQRTADYFAVPVIPYGPRPDSVFVRSLKSLRSNVLIVGHSNTVDDIVNALCGETKVPTDLSDTEYNRLFVVRMRGRKAFFEERKIFP
jgi:phosphohistidine phosphatase SixA